MNATKRRSVKLRIWVQFNLEQRGYETALLPKYRAVYGQAISVLTAQHARSKPGAPELHRSEPSFPGAMCAQAVKVPGCSFLNSFISDTLGTMRVSPLVHMKNRKITPKITAIPTLYPGGKRHER
jgi:hypothetical protein